LQWDPEGSPYYIEGDVYLVGAALTVLPGVEVIFNVLPHRPSLPCPASIFFFFLTSLYVLRASVFLFNARAD